MLDAVTWNIFRLAGDVLHLGGMALGLGAVWQSRSVEGFSRKTQVTFQVMYVCRYLDIFTASQNAYLLFFKVGFNVITALMLVAFVRWSSTYDQAADSCNLVAVLGPSFLLAHLTASGSGFREEMWTFSEFLEPLALIPQYIVCYRAARVRPAALLYMLALGGYRMLYILNWVYKRYKWHSAYHDYTSWAAGAVEGVIFVDFVVRIMQRKEVIGAIGTSPLGHLMLQLDEGAGRFAERVEMRTLGRRIPFGLSGRTSEDSEQERRQWDVSDKLGDEEGCRLLTLSGDPDAL